MSTSLTDIKNWFRTGLKPTQSQFWNTWDSFWHKDESIPTAKITDLDSQLANIPTSEQLAAIAALSPVVITVAGAATYSIAAGKFLEVVVADAASSGSVKVGTSLAGTQIIDDAVAAGVPTAFRVDHYSKNAGTIHLTGTFTAKLYLR